MQRSSDIDKGRAAAPAYGDEQNRRRLRIRVLHSCGRGAAGVCKALVSQKNVRTLYVRPAGRPVDPRDLAEARPVALACADGSLSGRVAHRCWEISLRLELVDVAAISACGSGFGAGPGAVASACNTDRPEGVDVIQRYTVPEPYEEDMLDVGEGNRVYWQVRGTPGGKPAVVVHGGRGGHCSS